MPDKKRTINRVVITDDVWKKIIILIEEGATLKEISSRPDMPCWEGMRKYMNRDEARVAEYTRAREVATDAFEAQLFEEMSNPDPAAARVRVDTLKWIMARRSPKRYGDKITQEHTGPNGEALQPPTLILRPFTKDDADHD